MKKGKAIEASIVHEHKAIQKILTWGQKLRKKRFVSSAKGEITLLSKVVTVC